MERLENTDVLCWESISGGVDKSTVELMTETVQCAYFGWMQASDMPKVYNHATSEDVEKRLIDRNQCDA